MIRKLAHIANKPDSVGLTEEADVIDQLIRKISQQTGSPDDKAQADLHAAKFGPKVKSGAELVSLYNFSPMPNENTVKQMQKLLTDAGFNTYSIDGKWEGNVILYDIL
jgi:hypothetical protein